MTSSVSTSQISSLDITDLQRSYLSRTHSPIDVVREVYKRISTYHDKAVWIHLISEAEVSKHAEELISKYNYHDSTAILPPLFGIPFSIKDSIDVEGLPTTLACPSFSYTATATAPVIQRILNAGGILIGKTNLDQFATGLTGVRSPYGIPRCVFDTEYVSGGSSSGSVVSVAASLVSFTVCTDTGGSTRVPAAYNGVIGLKPTLGTISTEGLFPACKNIDCVCVIARTINDADQAYQVMKAYDANDIYARRDLPTYPPWHTPIRIAIPPQSELDFLSTPYASLFQKFTTTLFQSNSDLLTHSSTFDYSPFAKANQMLYDSSIVAQRLLAFTPYISTHGLSQLEPSIQTTFSLAQASNFSATDAYRDIFMLASHRRAAEAEFLNNLDVLIVPSTVNHPTLAELEAEPIATNKVLGRFTNFVNLLDLCAVAVPVGIWKNAKGREMSFGVTIVAQAGRDHEILELARRIMSMERVKLD